MYIIKQININVANVYDKNIQIDTIINTKFLIIVISISIINSMVLIIKLY